MLLNPLQVLADTAARPPRPAVPPRTESASSPHSGCTARGGQAGQLGKPGRWAAFSRPPRAPRGPRLLDCAPALPRTTLRQPLTKALSPLAEVGIGLSCLMNAPSGAKVRTGSLNNTGGKGILSEKTQHCHTLGARIFAPMSLGGCCELFCPGREAYLSEDQNTVPRPYTLRQLSDSSFVKIRP